MAERQYAASTVQGCLGRRGIRGEFVNRICNIKANCKIKRKMNTGTFKSPVGESKEGSEAPASLLSLLSAFISPHSVSPSLVLASFPIHRSPRITQLKMFNSHPHRCGCTAPLHLTSLAISADQNHKSVPQERRYLNGDWISRLVGGASLRSTLQAWMTWILFHWQEIQQPQRLL
ncbi:hypothetical protein F2P81_009903 [Scophthalmus maximus]|uniref:Uncharacterized protein n=1 Tax=Scophthalmus maximus TaxID=52904 RepID=A0A6A4SWF4_SCOMX|nr:hypothetical protein F2P81_009903 [Scophthalmus maximus]